MEQSVTFYLPALRDGQELVVTALPLYHIFALTVNCLAFMRLGAANLLITNPRDIPALVKELRKYRPSCLTGVNTLFNALLNNEDFRELDFSELRLVVGGGMSVQHAVAERWEQLTKTSRITSYNVCYTKLLRSPCLRGGLGCGWLLL